METQLARSIAWPQSGCGEQSWEGQETQYLAFRSWAPSGDQKGLFRGQAFTHREGPHMRGKAGG